MDQSSIDTQRGPSPHTLGQIVGGLATDAQDLVRGEIKLARAELDQKLHRVIMAAIWLLGGALVAFAGLVVVLQGIAAAVAAAFVVSAWVAALIVGVVIIGIGALFAKSGVGMLSLKALSPDRTAANLQKDAHMLKEHT